MAVATRAIRAHYRAVSTMLATADPERAMVIPKGEPAEKMLKWGFLKRSERWLAVPEANQGADLAVYTQAPGADQKPLSGSVEITFKLRDCRQQCTAAQ